MSGGSLYPAPTLQVFPGETLIVHLENGLSDLTIRDYFTPQYTPKGETVPTYPEQMTSSPLNLHVHGVHVSPKGNADNVLLHIPAGMSNTYTYNIPMNMPQGAYWYHSHLHGLTAAQTYLGLVGLLSIGRTDGNLPLVTQNSIPVRNMLLQYNFVFDRANGLAQLNNPYWPQFVSSITPPQGDELAKGTYRPLLTPVNFNQSKPGEKYFTVWYAGPLSIRNERGLFQFIPSNLLRFTRACGQCRSGCSAKSVASRLPARRAVHGQRPVPAGHQKQGRPDRDLGALQCQRHRLHERPADGNGNRAASQDRHRRPGRKPLSRRPLPRHRQRHAAAHSAGQPVRNRRDDSCGRRAGARDAAARGRREDDHRTRRALHQQWHGQSSGRARQLERAAVRRQLRRRVLRLPDPGVGKGRAVARSQARRPRLPKDRRSAPIRPSSSFPTRPRTSSARSGSPEDSSTTWRARTTRNHSSMPSTAVHFQTCR